MPDLVVTVAVPYLVETVAVPNLVVTVMQCLTDWITIPCASNTNNPTIQAGTPVVCTDRSQQIKKENKIKM